MCISALTQVIASKSTNKHCGKDSAKTIILSTLSTVKDFQCNYPQFINA